MRTHRLMFAVILLTLAPASLSAAGRTFVSATGLDTNACTTSAPCRSFATAMLFTDVDGELIVLDSAGYGAVAIGQSVTLFVPDGIYGGITATTGDAVSVNVTSSDRVILRGLTINGLGAANGIHFVAGGKLRIDNVRVNNFQSRQIWSEAAGSISIHNCAIRGHRLFGSYGIIVSTAMGSAQAFIANTDVEDGGECIFIGANTTATVVNSRANQCGSRGFRVVTGGNLTIEGCAATNSDEGLLAGCGGGTARISNSTFIGNFYGVRLCGGIVYTRGNNTFGANFEDVNSGPMTALAAQ